MRGQGAGGSGTDVKTVGRYHEDGYAHLQSLIAPGVAQAIMQCLKQDIGDDAIALSEVDTHPNLLRRPAFEIYGYHNKPMLFFLWGLTPIISQIVDRDLLPTYDYFRIYREGDICKVHSDREACEFSLSLTLDYSDGEAWALEVGNNRLPGPSARVTDDFGSERFHSVVMNVGDAVLYQGVRHRHGRTTPNPNAWSAHLFLHWVDRNGPYADRAFDGQSLGSPINFLFV